MSQRQNREANNHFTDIGQLRNNLTSKPNSIEKQAVLQHWPSDYIQKEEPPSRNSRQEQTVGDVMRHPKYSQSNSSQKPPVGKLFATQKMSSLPSSNQAESRNAADDSYHSNASRQSSNSARERSQQNIKSKIEEMRRLTAEPKPPAPGQRKRSQTRQVDLQQP